MRKLHKMSKKKKSIESMLWALSPWLMFISNGGEAMIQTIFPIIILLAIVYIIKNKKISLVSHEDKLIILYTSIVTLSSLIAIVLNLKNSNISQLFGMFYFVFICFWFLTLSNRLYTEEEKKYIYISHILFGVTSSIQVIYFSYIGMTGKLTLISVFGYKINPNHFAAIISLLTIFQFIKVFLLNKNLTLKNKILNLISLIILVYGLILTGSRAAFLGTLLSIFIVFVQYLISNINAKKIFIAIILISLSFFVATNIQEILPPWLYRRYISNSYEDESNELRIHYWRNGIRSLQDSPLIGYGTGTLDKIDAYSTVLNSIPIPSSAPAHNTYIDFLIYGGVIGGAVIIAFMSILIFKFTKRNIFFLAFVVDLIFLTIIVGSDKSIYLWSAFIFMKNRKDFNA